MSIQKNLLVCNVSYLEQLFWPLDADWYSGLLVSYNSETSRHHVKYEDVDEEILNLSNERVKFHVSCEEM